LSGNLKGTLGVFRFQIWCSSIGPANSENSGKIRCIIDNSADHWPTVMTFDSCAWLWVHGGREIVKYHF